MTCSFNIFLKLQAGFLEHLTMEPSPERYLLITLIATIICWVTEAKMLQKIAHIIEYKMEFSLKTWEWWTWKCYWGRSSKAFVPKISIFKCIRKSQGHGRSVLCSASISHTSPFLFWFLNFFLNFLFLICCFLSSLVCALFFLGKRKKEQWCYKAACCL